MLVEIYSPVFRKNRTIRPPIRFNLGLNVIQGTDQASNSIGKSSALLAIDFVFGGDTYLDSDGVRNIGNHTIYSCFEFDKKYYFGRSTADPDLIKICNYDYSEKNKTLTKSEFLNWLKEKYSIDQTNLSFRQLISTYFRIYGKNNLQEKFPLQGYQGQNTRDSIKVLISLFNYYKKIELYQSRFDLESDKLKTYKSARKYDFISSLVGGKNQYEENLQKIADLKATLDSLTDTNTEAITQEEIEESKRHEALKEEKYNLEVKLSRLKRRVNLINVSLEYGLMPTEADLEALTEYFPNTDIKKIYEVENYHKKLSNILNTEIEKEKEQIAVEIKELSNTIDSIINEMSKLKIKNTFSKEFLNRHSALQFQISALENQNKVYLEETELATSKADAKNRLEKNIESILSNIAFRLNEKMQEFNSKLYEEKRNAPTIALKNYNNYNFSTPKDTGTGTNFKGMILLDLAILYLSSLPALAHDSLLFKNIDDEGIDGIIKLYTATKQLGKQVFIAFDKQSSYSKETYSILQENRVLQLDERGGELYGKSWNREVNNETQL
ncbi:hypothetical protein MM26B8_03050 [Mycoplasmopsis meleagridis]|uniref:DUF2326 domain-containing protein n=1 Tax=Mycoplasmopsis meleagridis ATCC 25294 TaxID=1264554 RepID=A0A0F5H1H3_9BACT|nr:DUF2326 domain-containing protein [Mycoplasmopsis meleagridis]KKB27028.1 hypothetical protein MMELEA_03450 [Mycoplasmopsis meleagridis ATCC 25294]OAD18376.1 hypothetical protein MM26B8_03050 [Mycoplasmopsis meleagridis]VEU77508.1 Uncharacterised protein [Mycoplasmopsis meleagridis]